MPTIRWNLKHLALFVAILAVAFGLVGVGPTVVGLAVCSPTLLARPGRKLASLYWVVTCYPVFGLLSLYVTWFTGWAALGHPPRPSLDDPKDIHAIEAPYLLTMLFLMGSPFALLMALGLMVARVANDPRKEREWRSRSAPLFIVPAIFFVSFLLLRWDPLNVLNWYFD